MAAPQNTLLQYQFPEQYYFKEYIVEKLPYKIAVCADSDQFAEEIKVVKL